MANTQRQLAVLKQKIFRARAAQQGRFTGAATLDELQRYAALCAQAHARRAAGAAPLSARGTAAAAAVPLDAWLHAAERAEATALIEMWQRRAKAQTALDQDWEAAVQEELDRRAAAGSAAPVDRATAAERQRARTILDSARARATAGDHPPWWRSGLEVTPLDLVPDDALAELRGLVETWNARPRGEV